MKIRKALKPEVLVAEGSAHYKILEQIYHLLEPHCNLTFYLIDTKRYIWEELFPSSCKTRVIKCNLKGIPFFAKLILLGWRYEIIYISTGPDHDHWTDFFRVLTFYVVCKLYGNKIIFTFRNVYPYLKSTPGIYANLRNRCMRSLKRITFETATMRDTFINLQEVKEVLYGVTYDRYADVRPSCYIAPNQRTDINNQIRIGLLGTISGERRNYDLLCEALGQVPEKLRSRLHIVTLGACDHGNRNMIIKKLSQYVSMDCQAGTLSEEDFWSRGQSCDVIISPLNQEKAYGTLFGTGSLGDAVYLRKKLIFPAFADPANEFSEICCYYSTATELAVVLRAIENLIADKVPDVYFENFYTKQVFDSLVRDLHLEEMCKEKQ